MIHITCDCCGKEPQNPDFAFEATIMEVGVVLTGENLNSQRRINKRMIQICQNCYKKHLEKLLKYGK